MLNKTWDVNKNIFEGGHLENPIWLPCKWYYINFGNTIRFLDPKNICLEQKIITLSSLEPEI